MILIKTLVKDKNGKIIPANIKVYNKKTSGVLMEFEIPIDEKSCIGCKNLVYLNDNF